jgi:ABC-type sugar transport system ATPase subunit
MTATATLDRPRSVAAGGAPAILTQGLAKRYGRHDALVDLDLEDRRGEVFGLIGPNGAGKTTTIRLLLDLIRPTRGSARILGLDVRRDGPAVRSRVGYLPGDLALYEDLAAEEHLAYLAALRGRREAGGADAFLARVRADVADVEALTDDATGCALRRFGEAAVARCAAQIDDRARRGLCRDGHGASPTRMWLLRRRSPPRSSRSTATRGSIER